MVTATVIEILKFCGIYTLSLVIIFLVVTAYINCYTFLLDNFDETVVKKERTIFRIGNRKISLLQSSLCYFAFSHNIP